MHSCIAVPPAGHIADTHRHVFVLAFGAVLGVVIISHRGTGSGRGCRRREAPGVTIQPLKRGSNTTYGTILTPPPIRHTADTPSLVYHTWV